MRKMDHLTFWCIIKVQLIQNPGKEQVNPLLSGSKSAPSEELHIPQENGGYFNLHHQPRGGAELTEANYI